MHPSAFPSRLPCIFAVMHHDCAYSLNLNVLTIHLCLVMQGNPHLTATFDIFVVSATFLSLDDNTVHKCFQQSKHFIIGNQHSKFYKMPKQAMYDTYTSTLSCLYKLEAQVKTYC